MTAIYTKFSRTGEPLLNVDDAGGVGLPVIFQHGLCGDARQTVEAFPRDPRFRRITIESRGHGGSEAGDPGLFSIRTFAADIVAFIEAHRLGPITIGGISMGAASTLHIAVVGGGPGGYAAAFLAADLGLKVTLIDPEVNPGGVCLYRGCIPSKALLHVAKLIEESHQAKNWGIEFSEPRIDLARLRGWKDSVVKRLTGGLGQLSKQRSVKYVQGRASFENSNTLRVSKAGGGEELLSSDRIILATGSRPAVIPSLKIDSPRVMDSTCALDLEEIPKSLLVVGGGYIGLELGSVYRALGTRVTVVEMLSGLLPGADRDLVQPLHKRLEKSFDAILLNTTVKSLTEESGGIRATFDGADVK